MTKRGQAPLGTISARLRDEEYPLHNTKARIKINFNQLTAVRPELCDHEETICPTAACIESWGLHDWQLFLGRTKAGRVFISDLNLTEEDLVILSMKIRPSNRHLPSCDTVPDRHPSARDVPIDTRRPRVRINTTKKVEVHADSMA